MSWHIYDAKTLRLIEPRRIDGKSQADIAAEIAEALESCDVAIVEMATGCGKTMIALSGCYEYGPDKRVIYNAGPYRARQVQIARDFTERFLVGDGERFWTFGIVWGRENYTCPRIGVPCSEAPCMDRTRRHEYPCYAPPVRGRSRIGERTVLAEWTGVDGSTWCLPETECPYYRQFTAYEDRDVIVMNSFMWICETMLGRKPRVEVEIIDEFDAVLQEITPRIAICEEDLKPLAVLVTSLPASIKDEYRQALRRIRRLIRYAYRMEDIIELAYEYQRLVLDLASLFPEEFADDDDLKRCLENARKLRALQLDLNSYVPVRKRSCIVLTCVDSEKHVRNILSMCGRKKILISATPPPEPVLEHVYGIRDYVYIRAGHGVKGIAYLGGTFNMYVQSRPIKAGNKQYTDRYRMELRETVRLARMDGFEPRLIVAISRIHLDFLYMDMNVEVDWNGRKLQEFIDGKLLEVASTRVYRAIDLPGDKCRSIVITKCPWPDLEDPWWIATSRKLEKVGYTREFIEHLYRQLAKHNLLQIIGRALRSEDDWVWIYSPDRYVLELLLELEREGRIRLIRDVVPETRRIVQEVLTKIEKEGIASIEILDSELRAKIKHILEKWFACIVHEVENYLIIVHRARQHELEQLAKQLIKEIESQAQPTTSQTTTLNNIDNNIRSIDKNIDEDWQGSRRSNSLSMKENTLIIVQFKQDCLHYRKGDIATIPKEVLEQCKDKIDPIDLNL